MKKLAFALGLPLIIALASPSHPAEKGFTGCIKKLIFASSPLYYSSATVADKSVIFGKDKMHVSPKKVQDGPAFTPQDWAKREKEWGLLMAGAQAKVQANITYEDTTNVVLIVSIRFDSPCQ